MATPGSARSLTPIGVALYGPETNNIRAILRKSVVILANRIWHDDGSNDARKVVPFVESSSAELLYQEILKLAPLNENQRLLQSRAIEAITDV